MIEALVVVLILGVILNVAMTGYLHNRRVQMIQKVEGQLGALAEQNAKLERELKVPSATDPMDRLRFIRERADYWTVWFRKERDRIRGSVQR